jgi:hypothetical protein
MRIALVTFATLLTACDGGDGGAPDSGSTDAAMLTCAQIRDGLRERAQVVSKQCTTDDDCELVGYPAWSTDVRAQELLAQWQTRCLTEGCGVSGTCGCDCGSENAVCGVNGSCGATNTNVCGLGAN